VRVLMISEMNAPNINVYPDKNQVGVEQCAEPALRALTGVEDALPPNSRSRKPGSRVPTMISST